jgi:type IV secretion system protein VirB8
MKWSKKLNLNNDSTEAREDDSSHLVTDVRNWYADRYEYALVQRNILLFLTVLCLILICVLALVTRHVNVSKTVDPFVIEVEEKTGMTNVVNPFSRNDLLTNEALNTYFIMKYLRARETYDFYTYQYNYSTVVRLMSSFSVYAAFRNFVNNDPKSPIKTFNTNISTALKVRSLQFLDNGTTAQVRFSIFRNNDNSSRSDKIATITFAYLQMEMTTEERYVNPLGFQVISYRVDDEIL